MNWGMRLAGLTLLLATAVVARTEIKGEYSGFLKAEGSPYLVTETLVVPEGKALLVESGVVIEFVSGAGLDVQGGSFAVDGTSQKPVVMQPAPGYGSWNGISITGQHSAELQNVDIRGAEIAIAIENGVLELKNANIENSVQIGLYARSSAVDVQWSKFKFNKGVTVWASNDAELLINSSEIFNNHIGVLAGQKSQVNLQTSKIAHNEYGVVDMERNSVRQLRTQIEQNRIGLLANDVPADDLKKIAQKNQKNMEQGVGQVANSLPEEPRNPFAEIFRAAPAKKDRNDGEMRWSRSGKVEAYGGYHQVWTRTNRTGKDYIVGTDTVAPMDDYINYFQVPGPFGGLNAYLLMESTDGRNFEVSTSVASDTWNHFDVENFLVSYSDRMQRLALGDVYLVGGNIYMAGLNVFGGSYDLNLFKNAHGNPLFVVSAYGGEVQKPKLIGDRNEDIYKDYIEDGEVEPQKLLVGGKVRWNMHRRFNGTLGFIGSKDFLDDPLLRDGSRPDVNTSSPIISSKTFFADGNWLLFPGDIELNGQVAVGAADTANATLQRAINEVFVSAGVDASNLSKIRKLMNNPALVDFLTYEELEAFFGDNTMKSRSELQKKLKSLLAQAKSLKNRYNADEESQANLKNWDGQNLAFTGSLHWKGAKTDISGYVRFVGADYYSAGSPDLLQNSREVYGNLDRMIFDFWKLNFNYKINVENAAHGAAYNVLGLAEGEKLGLIPGADKDWLERHEQDEDRTLYEHDMNFNNDFKISKFWELSLGYNMDYRTRSTNQRLYGDYSSGSGVFDDSWFDPRGRATVDVVRGDDTLKIDSVRWAEYYSLRDQDYLATQFDEKIIRHIFKLGFKFNLPKNTLKVGGVWTLRRDMSKFEQDDLLEGFDFEDKTYGLMGYYFHGGDYFEQRYPVSLTTVVDGFHNMFSVTPRYKIYNRDDMTDFEWTVADNMTIPLSKNFLDLLLSGSFRQEFQARDDEDGSRIEESEMDVSGSGTLRFMHTGNLTSEWTIGAFCAYRPDYKADQYKDLFGMVSVSYSF